MNALPTIPAGPSFNSPPLPSPVAAGRVITCPRVAESSMQALEAGLHADVVQHSGCDPARFIPHVQPHEFEALLFSDVAALAAVEAGWAAAAGALGQARAGAAAPEDINDGQETKPSSRLEALLRSPSYRKLRHGPIAAERIGVARMEAECPHFASWLARLRALWRAGKRTADELQKGLPPALTAQHGWPGQAPTSSPIRTAA